MLIITDLNNNAHALLATVEHNIELNGNEDINITIHKQQSTIDLKTISYLHTITWHGNDYKIINLEKITFGDSYYLEIVAIPLFYYHFQKSVIDDNYDGSHTAVEAFRIIFENSGYTPMLVDFSGALKLEGFGKGATRMEMFQQAVERYQYEFEIKGSQVYLKHRIGSDTNFLYKYKLNATDIKQTIDASNYFVTINGFADFEEGTEDYKNKAKIKRTYTHPIADILGEFKPQGRSYTNGAIKTVETLDAALKKAVEDSLEISVEASLYDIRKMGYKDAVPYRGDRVFLIDERFDFKQEIRVFSVKSIYDANDELVKCDVTFGSMSQADKYKGRINDLSKAFSDLIEGRKKLPIISLEKIGMDMIKSIHDASSDIIFGPFGMQAISKSDPNRVFGLNSEGWYISQDGGRTPKTIATADGIVANAITSGSLNTSLVRVFGMSDGEETYIAGGKIRSTGSFVRTFPQGLAEYESYTESWNGTYRSGLISKTSNGKTQTNITRWLSLNDKAVTTQREIHSASPDKNGARFIDFFAEETYSSDVTGQGMHIYSGQALNIESEYGLYLNSKQRFYIRTEDSGLEINKNGQNLVLKRTSPFGSEVGTGGSYMSIQSSDGVEQGNVGILSDNRNLSVKSSFGDVHLRGKMTKVFDSDSENYTDITAKDFIKASSRELKTNIEPLVDGIEKIKSLTPVAYDYKHDLENGIESGDIGFIAEDSECIAVADGKAISVQKVATWAVLATKEQQDIIEQHEEMIKQQDEKIQQQEEIINKLIERIEALESK